MRINSKNTNESMSRYIIKTCYLIGILLVMMMPGVGCKKMIDVNAPLTSTNAENVYSNDATAAAVLTGIYGQISDLNIGFGNDGITSISLYTALSSDELTLYSINDTRYSPYYKNDLSSLVSSGVFWNNLYSNIFFANSAIEGLTSSNGLTPGVQKQLIGEAKFVRAFCYFYLVNLYGDVPLVTSNDYKINSQLSRASKADVYNWIISDLKDAQTYLSDRYLKSDALTAYSTGTEQRVRPTKWAATALLARVYLYTGDWANAEAQASVVINNSTLFSLVSLSHVFEMNSYETIWSLQPVGTGPQSNTGEGTMFILPDSGPNASTNVVYLSNNVVNSFEQGDLRKVDWMGSAAVDNIIYNYPYKYKIGNVNTTTAEYIMMIRFGEQYLIRAEARARQNNLPEAIADLDQIRNRAALPLIANTNPGISQSELLNSIMHERQIELFSEWGHRWFDLKRTNAIDVAMDSIAAQKGGSWSDYKSLYPIPQSEINVAPNLIQSTGY